MVSRSLVYTRFLAWAASSCKEGPWTGQKWFQTLKESWGDLRNRLNVRQDVVVILFISLSLIIVHFHDNNPRDPDISSAAVNEVSSEAEPRLLSCGDAGGYEMAMETREEHLKPSGDDHPQFAIEHDHL